MTQFLQHSSLLYGDSRDQVPSLILREATQAVNRPLVMVSDLTQEGRFRNPENEGGGGHSGSGLPLVS